LRCEGEGGGSTFDVDPCQFWADPSRICVRWWSTFDVAPLPRIPVWEAQPFCQCGCFGTIFREFFDKFSLKYPNFLCSRLRCSRKTGFYCVRRRTQNQAFVSASQCEVLKVFDSNCTFCPQVCMFNEFIPKFSLLAPSVLT